MQTDLDGFNPVRGPNFFYTPPQWIVETNVKNKEAPQKSTEPTPDSRFPGWAAPMTDGRLVTDYRPRCSLNFPTGTQFATKHFMQQNAVSIMEKSRMRQASRVGAGQAYDRATEVNPQILVQCDSVECSYSPYDASGLGVERTENVPELFGTYAYSSASIRKPSAPMLTTKFEGGRNTPRSTFS